MSRSRSFAALAAVLALAGPLAARARAADDEHEFGEKLGKSGYFDYARRVFEGISKDDKRPAEARARARYGLALLAKDEAMVLATRQADLPYADAKAKFDEALKVIDEYVAANKGDEARQEAGLARLGVVDWLGRLQKDEKAIAARKTTRDAIVADAKAYAERAIAIFKELREGAKNPDAQQYATYNLAMSQYYRAYAEVPCSPSAVAGFEQASLGLEDYATLNEERLLGVYALDFLGMSDWELAKCKSDPKDREQAYGKALGWFDACTQTPNDSMAHTQIIARGFYHMAQMCAEAGRQEKTDFLKVGAQSLARVQEVDRVLKVDEGVLALLEWAEIEDRRGNGGEAFKLAKQASDAARDAGFDAVVARANAALARYAPKAKASDIDPDALMKIAENLYKQGKHDEAVPAFQQAILAAGGGAENRQRFVLPAWSRIGFAYRAQGLLFEAAAAWDVVVAAWRSDPQKGKEGEPKTDLAYSAAQGVKTCYEELAQKTRDPVLQARLTRIREDIPRLFPMVSSAQDQAYAQALQLSQEGFQELAADASSTSGRPKVERARVAFVETGKNLKSERQDNAWSNLVELHVKLGRYDGAPAYEAAIKAADEAFAYWDSPPAKKRLQEEREKIGGNRTQQGARVTMQKLRALTFLGRWDQVLALAKEYPTAWPTAEALWKEIAAGAEARALAALGRIPEAEQAVKGLVEKYPGSDDLGPVVIEIAKHYQAQTKPMEDRISEISKELVGTREAPGLQPRLDRIDREQGSLQERLVSTTVAIERWEAAIRNAQAGQEGLKVKAREEIAKLAAEKAKLEKELAEVVARRAEIEPRIAPLVEERDRLRREVAGPMALAARRYVEWDEAVKKQDERTGKPQRSADNVQNFAYRYYYLAQLKPEETEYWRETARLYEEYFALAETKAVDDARKRRYHTYYGEALYALAVAEKDAEKARPLYEKAVANLEKGLARVAANTPLVIGMLSGEYVTLPFEDPSQNRTFHFPIRRAAVTDAASFKAYVANLKETDLPQYPPYRVAERGLYADRALRQFQVAVSKMDDATARRAAESVKVGGFDPSFFAEHADASADSLLPLARAYIRSGVKDFAVRARQAAQILLKGPTPLETGSPEWWMAQTVVLHFFVSDAERGQAASAKAADTVLVSFKRLFPRIGGSRRHEETLAEWKALQVRLAAVASGLGVTTTPVDLAADTPPPPAPEAGTPAPGEAPDAPPAPPGAGAGTGGPAAGTEDK